MRTMSMLLAAAALTLAMASAACSGAPQDAGQDAGQADSGAGFENRVWMQDDAASGRPGVMRVFLSGGSLIMDSCWETYRLAAWRRIDADTIAWDEDGVEIVAGVAAPEDGRLMLTLKLRGGEETMALGEAAAPYLCPDVPKE
ncbi:MAG: hypothetical protein GC152_03380 [Alphaproteobacteria bacterium]|nr:hypothetical protein [Alphaproteobacteria bacterium]